VRIDSAAALGALGQQRADAIQGREHRSQLPGKWGGPPNGSGDGFGTAHRGTQRNPIYEQALCTRFNDVVTPEEALVVLGQIKQELRDGAFLGSKKGNP
jgi:hypothetical protein